MALSSFSRSGLSRVTSPSNAVISGSPTGTYTDAGVSYNYFTFTGNGTLTVDSAGFADVLVVGGGGGSGVDDAAGGGGAGGHVYLTNVYLPSGSVTCTVGGGGAGAANQNSDPSVGTDSSMLGYIAIGGGASASDSGNKGTRFLRGGSGAGGSLFNDLSGGLGISGQGNNGGSGGQPNNYPGGGGGGASAVGANATSTVGGNGGNGTANSITGTSVTRAGGGGGGTRSSTAGTGGTGGGGNGGSNAHGTAGGINTGGGAGGSGTVTGGPAASGGSGVVIVRVRTN